MAGSQRPIHFGGVVLSELPAADKARAKDAVFARNYGIQGNAVNALIERVTCDQRPPAGEASFEARLVAVSRWSLAARIKHGVPMSELRSHFEALQAAEEVLLNE